jgi:arylsulfatase A-like enzyme
MLEPSEKWLEEKGDEPFVATYETITPHHQYLAPTRYGRENFAADDDLNRYQNTVRYVDFFVKNLIEQCKELGLYEDTIFIVTAGERVEEPVSQLDLLPTVIDLLGYEIVDGDYPGYSMRDLPTDRTLEFSCWYDKKCLASLKGDKKYIYHFGSQPEEFYDHSEDPLEKNNVANEVPPEELEARREELLEWRTRADAAYRLP